MNLRLGLAVDAQLPTAYRGKHLMTPNPRSISPEKLAVEAVYLIEQSKINGLPVVEVDYRLLGTFEHA